tara:strand:- start:45 stop:563 length:519 start_codon:yes stop_codon:yes gene_type:complete
MAGNLVQVNKAVGDGTASNLTVTGINTDDVYMVAFSNIFASANDDMQIRVTTSGTADSDSEYDWASKDLKTSGSFGNSYATNQDNIDFSAGIGTSGTNSHNGILYLFNFNNSSEYSFITHENVTTRDDSSDELFSFQGGAVHTVNEANDGIQFFLTGGNNIDSGTVTLYKVI